MQPHITKLCADYLRVFAQEHFQLTLGSSQAHELIAAFFGYESRASLLADTGSPIDNLPRADFVVLPPYNEMTSGIFRKRCESLRVVMLDEYDILNVVSEILYDQFGIIAFGQNLESIAVDIVRAKLKKRFSILGIDLDQINLNTRVMSSDVGEMETSYNLSNDYVSDIGIRTHRDSTMVVTFSRIAGYVGYKELDTQETRYTGEVRQIIEQKETLPHWPYPAGTLVMARNSGEVGIVLQAKDNNFSDRSVTICTDTSLSAVMAKTEVFPLADQSIKFTPKRLFMPYGKYICADGSEVLFNRDYNPLWGKTPDGSVIALEPDTWIDHDDSVYFYYGVDSNEIKHSKSMAILKEWGLKNKRPLILDLLPQAIETGNADILKAKRGGDMTKVFPKRS